jgi:hypothetical protein
VEAVVAHTTHTTVIVSAGQDDRMRFVASHSSESVFPVQEQQTAQDALHKAQIAAAKEQLHLMERLQELKTT